MLGVLLLAFYMSGGCQECDRMAVGVTYIPAKSAGIEAAYLGTFPVGGGIGITYDFPSKTYNRNGLDSIGNSYTVYTYVGHRIIQIPYKFSLYANIGAHIGNIRSAGFAYSVKFLLPNDTKAYVVEPFYSRKLGIKFTYYWKI